MKDPEIRALLEKGALKKASADPNTRIIPELGICGNRYRADVVVINDHMTGYEIKSESDSLRRFPNQIYGYDLLFDYCHLVTASKHLEKAKKILPDHWGIKIVEEGGRIKTIRRARKNPNKTIETAVRLLWRDEVYDILQKYNRHRGKSRWDKESLANCLIQDLTEDLRLEKPSSAAPIGETMSRHQPRAGTGSHPTNPRHQHL